MFIVYLLVGVVCVFMDEDMWRGGAWGAAAAGPEGPTRTASRSEVGADPARLLALVLELQPAFCGASCADQGLRAGTH